MSVPHDEWGKLLSTVKRWVNDQANEDGGYQYMWKLNIDLFKRKYVTFFPWCGDLEQKSSVKGKWMACFFFI